MFYWFLVISVVMFHVTSAIKFRSLIVLPAYFIFIYEYERRSAIARGSWYYSVYPGSLVSDATSLTIVLFGGISLLTIGIASINYGAVGDAIARFCEFFVQNW